MKRTAILIATALFVLGSILPAMAQEGQKTAPMQMYHVAVLKKGPNWTSQHTEGGGDTRTQIIKAIRQGAKEGLVITAGLVNDETDAEFIIILNIETKYEALELLNKSPNYKNGMFTADIYSMFAPTGLVVDLE